MLERMWRNGNPLALWGGMQTGAATLETVWSFLVKSNIDLRYAPAIALLGIHRRDIGVLMHRGTCTPMYIAALSTIARFLKEPKCPSTDEWIKNMWLIYTMEYYMAMRTNEIWPFVATEIEHGTSIELESVMLSEISHTGKTDTICFHSYVDPEKVNRRPWGRGRKNKVREGGNQTIRHS